MTLRPAPARPGLSLVEVMLALTILLFALAAIGSLVDVGIGHGNDARMQVRGTRLAQSKMAEVEAGVIPLDSEATGTFEGDDAAWQFTVTPEAAGPPNLYTVTVRVSRGSGKTTEIVLKQMVFDPTMTGSAAQAERPAPADTSTTDTTTTTTGGTSP